MHAQRVKLKRGTTIADTFHIIGNFILKKMAANEPAVRASDSEGVRQMRIGLRRLRVAISVFSQLLGDQQTKRIKRELR